MITTLCMSKEKHKNHRPRKLKSKSILLSIGCFLINQLISIDMIINFE
jgi:hypothetical protein